MNTEEIRNQLDELYRNIHQCHLCPKMDREKKLRRSDAVDPLADVFIVSQALAELTQRKTGVSFFDEKGQLGKTGRNLEEFLRKFKRTLYPPWSIQLEEGLQIPAREPEFLTVYNTEVTQCYPGKATGGGGDRVPDENEVLNCTNANFVRREMEIIKPKLVLLMGKQSRNSFFRIYLPEEYYDERLQEHINQIVAQGRLPQFRLSAHTANVCPIQHASSANPRFNKMSKDRDLMNLLANALM